jgi:hypothetical protein
MKTVRVCWVEPSEQLRGVEGEVADDVVRQGQLVIDADAGPGPAGVYRLLSDEECVVFDPQTPLPVFLHEDHAASIVRWMQPLQHAGDEVAVAEHVRKAVYDLVEARVGDDGVFSASAVLTSTETVSGSLHVVGRCVVIRPA